MRVFFAKLPFTLSSKKGDIVGKFKQIEVIIEAEDEDDAVRQLQEALQARLTEEIIDIADVEVLYEEEPQK